MKKKFVHICEEFEYTWIGKDNGMIPIYVHEILNCESEIVTCNLKKDLPDEIRGVKIIKISRWFKRLKNIFPWIIFFKRLPLYFWIKNNAKSIDVLMLFHITKCSYWNAYFYKKYNPSGKVYIKADFNLEVYKKELKKIEHCPKNIKEFFSRRNEIKEYKKRKKLIEISTLISYETKEAFNVMKKEYAGVNTEEKTIHIPNGYDSIYINKNFKIKNFKEKENIFLTVGRLGTKEKNTEIILKALEKIDLKDWKFYFIGSIEKSFNKTIDEFFEKFPEKKKNIIFTGVIKDKKILYEYYNKAKVFVLTSRWEGFALVFLEALAFSNYIVTTNVGGAQDVTKNGKNGIIIKNQEELCKELYFWINNIKKFKEGAIDKKGFSWLENIKKLEGILEKK